MDWLNQLKRESLRKVILRVVLLLALGTAFFVLFGCHKLLGTLSRDRHVIVDAQGQPVIPSAAALDLPPWEVFEASFALSRGELGLRLKV